MKPLDLRACVYGDTPKLLIAFTLTLYVASSTALSNSCLNCVPLEIILKLVSVLCLAST